MSNPNTERWLKNLGLIVIIISGFIFNIEMVISLPYFAHRFTPLGAIGLWSFWVVSCAYTIFTLFIKIDLTIKIKGFSLRIGDF